MAPGRLATRAPSAFANAALCSTGHFIAIPCRIAAANASPEPTVSTTSIGKPGKVESLPSLYTAQPLPPSVTHMISSRTWMTSSHRNHQGRNGRSPSTPRDRISASDKIHLQGGCEMRQALNKVQAPMTVAKVDVIKSFCLWKTFNNTAHYLFVTALCLSQMFQNRSNQD